MASENGSIAINAVSEVRTSTYSTVPTSVAVLRSSSSANVDVHNGAAISTTVTAGPANAMLAYTPSPRVAGRRWPKSLPRT